MTEHWKSTPRYWCKHCKTFVRDTKLERQNHDATPKHQGNLKRFLRDLHRGHEKDEKDKERAKSEVARLNGLVSGSGVGEGSSSSGFGLGPKPSTPKPQATPSQRKQQLSQLAEMGISIPDEFRGAMAMAGEWQVTAERVVDPVEGHEKPAEALGIGVRKRLLPGEEDEEETVEVKKKRWGSTYRPHPEADDNLDDLLNNTLKAGTTGRKANKTDPESVAEEVASIPKTEEEEKPPFIKRELSDGEIEMAGADARSVDLKIEEDAGTSVVFKKRKPKNVRKTGLVM